MTITIHDCDPQVLHITRVPGELGPVVRCSGELTLATGEALRRELDLLSSLHHPTLTLNVAACRSIDAEGILLMLDTYKRLQEQRRRFAVVSGTEGAARLLRILAIDSVLPVFPTEDSAALALRGGGPPDEAAVNWSTARAESVAMWQGVLEALEEAPTAEAMLRITSTHGLCQRAEELVQARSGRGGTRCRLCPLFHALGARPEDVGCQSLTQPMLEALLAGDRRSARTQVERLLRLLESMPLPAE